MSTNNDFEEERAGASRRGQRRGPARPDQGGRPMPRPGEASGRTSRYDASRTRDMRDVDGSPARAARRESARSGNGTGTSRGSTRDRAANAGRRPASARPAGAGNAGARRDGAPQAARSSQGARRSTAHRDLSPSPNPYRDDVNRSRRTRGDGPTGEQDRVPPHETRYRQDYRQDRSRASASPGRRPSGPQQRAAYANAPQGAFGSIFSPRVIKVALVAIAVLIAASLLVRCVASGGPGDRYETVHHVAGEVVTRVNACILSEDQIVTRLEQQGVDETWAQQAAQMAQTDRRFMMMAQQSESLGREGSEVTNKLVKLAVSDPEAIGYVVDFIDEYPQDQASPLAQDEVSKGTVPQFYQWDERWGYTVYSGTAFGCTGCGPTSMSMVYAGLTGKVDKSPADMARDAAEGGYETDYDGTVNGFFTAEASNLGLDVTELDVTADSLEGALRSGMPVICNVGPGDFTESGHFFVITALNDDGTVSINDPYSSVNSSESWDIDTILNQTIALYAYSYDDGGESTADGDESSESPDGEGGDASGQESPSTQA